MKKKTSTYEVVVNDSFSTKIETSSLEEADFIRKSENRFHFIKDHVSYAIELLESDFDKKTYTISLNDRIFKVGIKDSFDQLIDEMGFDLGITKHIDQLDAPMPGLILDIMVKPGQAVEAGDPLLILEAMKMENIITSPRNGVIKSIPIKVDSAVDKNDLLIEFEQ